MSNDVTTMPDSFFRQLDPEEEKHFRQWAREQPEDLFEPSQRALFHPVIRNEWQVIAAEIEAENRAAQFEDPPDIEQVGEDR